MSRTRKPCIGCGEVHPYRPADKLCHDCARDLQLGQRLRKKIKAGKADVKIYKVAEYGWSHWYPYIHVGHSGEAGDEFRRAFDLVVTQSSDPAEIGSIDTEILVPANNFTTSDQQYPVSMKPELAEGLRRLYLAVQSIADEAYKNGKADGCDLLNGLASGEMSVKEFNERSIQ